MRSSYRKMKAIVRFFLSARASFNSFYSNFAFTEPGPLHSNSSPDLAGRHLGPIREGRADPGHEKVAFCASGRWTCCLDLTRRYK